MENLKYRRINTNTSLNEEEINEKIEKNQNEKKKKHLSDVSLPLLFIASLRRARQLRKEENKFGNYQEFLEMESSSDEELGEKKNNKEKEKLTHHKFQETYGSINSNKPPIILKEEKNIHGKRYSISYIKKNDTIWEKWGLDVVWDMIISNPINILLFLLPFASLSASLGWGDTATFLLNFLALMPLAALLGDLTEEIAGHCGQTLGGLLSATMGNAVEVVVGITCLVNNQIEVVQASLMGSVLSNLLLVLGSAFFFGGIIYPEQTFNVTAAIANTNLLLLSSLGLILPTPFGSYYDLENDIVLDISRITAFFLLFMYAQLLIFQLKSHSFLFQEDDDDHALIPFWVAFVVLCLITFAVTIYSDNLVGAINGFTETNHISKTFVGLILLPIVGNAVEHATAVIVARRDKMELSMGIAVGSAAQVSLFVIPVITLIGWAIGRPMTLNFPHFELICYFMSIIIVAHCVSNGRSNWLEGSLLITTYIFISVAFWFLKVKEEN